MHLNSESGFQALEKFFRDLALLILLLVGLWKVVGPEIKDVLGEFSSDYKVKATEVEQRDTQLHTPSNLP